MTTLKSTSKIERVSDSETKINVDIPWQDVEQRIDKLYGDLRKKARIPGFRKGKVPNAVLRKMYGASIDQDISQELIKDSLPAAMQDGKVHAIAPPSVADICFEAGKPFTYSASVKVVPPIKIEKKEDVVIELSVQSITDEDVDRYLKGIQNQHGHDSTISNGNILAGDIIILDVIGKHNDEPVSMDGQRICATSFPAAKESTEVESELRSPALIDLIGESLIGKSASESELDIEINDASHNIGSGSFHITINSVTRRELPAIDDELAKDTGKAETLSELKSLVRSDMETQASEMATQDAKVALLDKVCELNDVPEIPELIEEQFRAMLSQRINMMKQYGMPMPTEKAQQEQMVEGLKEEAVKIIKRRLCLDALAQDVDSTVSDAEMASELDKQLSSVPEQSRAEASQYFQQKNNWDNMRRSLEDRKIVDWLWSKAQISNTKK